MLFKLLGKYQLFTPISGPWATPMSATTAS